MKKNHLNNIMAVMTGIVLISTSLFPQPAKADFFDDLVDALNPVTQFDNLLNGRFIPFAGDLTLIPLPMDISSPTFPYPDDVLAPPLVPIARTKDATDITSHSSKIHGYADPKGAPDT